MGLLDYWCGQTCGSTLRKSPGSAAGRWLTPGGDLFQLRHDLVRHEVGQVVGAGAAAEGGQRVPRGEGHHRLVQPDEVAAAVMWLVGDAAISVTGQAIAISGGA